MYFIIRNIDTLEIASVRYNANFATVQDVDVESGQEAAEVTEAEFQQYSEKPLSISKYKYDNGIKDNAQKITATTK